MNPARTFGPVHAAGFWADHRVYRLGPVLGAVAASLAYRYRVAATRRSLNRASPGPAPSPGRRCTCAGDRWLVK
ncbi:aquaporin [Caldinitratiruptor microaerophilus]|uniref:aquaporin n=1 Tax=Caldinitratiruptor microaerophilus TaxID=671077 RepID=UPI003872BB9B